MWPHVQSDDDNVIMINKKRERERERERENCITAEIFLKKKMEKFHAKV